MEMNKKRIGYQGLHWNLLEQACTSAYEPPPTYDAQVVVRLGLSNLFRLISKACLVLSEKLSLTLTPCEFLHCLENGSGGG